MEVLGARLGNYEGFWGFLGLRGLGLWGSRVWGAMKAFRGLGFGGLWNVGKLENSRLVGGSGF